MKTNDTNTTTTNAAPPPSGAASEAARIVQDGHGLKWAAKRIKELTGRRLCIESIRRYCRYGVKLSDGSYLRLKSVRLSGQRFVTEEGVRDFCALWLLDALR